MPTTTVTSSDHRTLQTIADTIHSSKRILVITGAGISTNSGIPDFRSTHGLYNLVKSRYPPSISSNSISTGKDLFSSSLFTDPTSTSIFYSFLAELRESVLRVEDTTPTHKFIRTLAESGRLLRCYTQNIDGLEGREGLATDLSLGASAGNTKKRKRCSLAGVPGEIALSDSTGAPNDEIVIAPKRGCQVVQLHGELDTLRCMHCQGICFYTADRVAALMDGRAPDCPSCVMKDRERREAGKRGTRVGGLRPNIVLYGEEHPQGEAIGKITSADLKSGPDLMIIFGTSLKVHGLKRLVKEFAASIHARKRKSGSTSTSISGEEGSGEGKPSKHDVPRVIFVNNQPAANSVWKDIIDAWVDMDCDEFVSEIKSRRPAVWERQERLEAGFRRVVEGKAGGSGKGLRTGKGKGGIKVKNNHNLTPKASKAQTPPEESDKENSSSNSSPSPIKSTTQGKSKSKSLTSTPTPSQKKKSPLVSSSSNTNTSTQRNPKTLPTIVLATPQYKRTPLPTPPSSVSKPRSGAPGASGSGRTITTHRNFTASPSPSLSPLSSLATTPSISLPGTPARVGGLWSRFECMTPSRLRHALSTVAGDDGGDDEGEEERECSRRSKRRRIDNGEEGSEVEGEIEAVGAMDIPVRRRLFFSEQTSQTPRQKQMPRLLKAVVITSPSHALTKPPAAGETKAKAKATAKGNTSTAVGVGVGVGVVQSTITTRSKLKITKAAALETTLKIVTEKERENIRGGEKVTGARTGTGKVDKEKEKGIGLEVDIEVRTLLPRIDKTWRVGERRSERSRRRKSAVV